VDDGGRHDHAARQSRQPRVTMHSVVERCTIIIHLRASVDVTCRDAT